MMQASASGYAVNASQAQSLDNRSSDDLVEERRINMPNTLQTPGSGGLKYGQRRRNSNSHPRPCRPPIAPFESDTYAEIDLKLDCLKNFEVLEELPKPGDFIIRVMCMGQIYGHFPSGNVTLQQTTLYPRFDEPNSQRCPDIQLDHEISFCMRFRDLVDNPLVLQLCYGGDTILDFENLDDLSPFGYICLDLGRILNYKVSKVPEHIEAWIFPDKRLNNGIHFSSNDSLVPCLQMSIECTGGLPETSQLLQGNLMTVFCESLHNLPSIVQQNVAYPDKEADVQMYMTLPHSQSEPILRFPGGKYKESFLSEPMFRKASIDENTQTSLASMVDPTRESTDQNKQQHNQTAMGQGSKDTRFWASVKENSPEMPLEGTTMAETLIDPGEFGNDADMEIYGDGREDFMEFSGTCEPRLVWNSVHRKYVCVDAYRGMLGRLAQNAVWPIEISVAVRKKKSAVDRLKERKKKEGGIAASVSSRTVATDAPVSTTSSNESNDRMIMSELGRPSLAAASDYTLVYHGIAFVDLSCLVSPGIKSARFSCKVFPYSHDLLLKKTCVTESMLPEPLLMTLIPSPMQNSKAGGAPSHHPSTKRNPKSVRPSQGSNDMVPSLQETQMTKAVPRKSDFPETSKGKTHEDGGGPGEGLSSGPVIERNPFIVFRITMMRSIVPCYRASEISKVVEEYLPKRELTRRKLMNSSSAQQKYRRAILEAAAEISREFSEHYWKDVLQLGQGGLEHSNSNAASNEALKKGFLFYLNASGRYLILREHLRSAISNVVQQKCINLRPSGFHNHRDFQSYLHDMYVYLVDEMHEILSSTTLQETDPLKNNMDRLLQQPSCNAEEELSKSNMHSRQMRDLGIFAEESLAQGDFETCHKLHLQRICRDKESSRCWTDFAIMWLARGDDRMAEISVREALRKDPLYFYALLISGIISVRHGDERGLECLGAALGLYPMAPEMLVIVGIANSSLGNDLAADYFFRKAAYVHRTITGQPVDEIDKIFATNNAKKPFDLKKFAQDMDSGVSHLPEQKKHVQVPQVQVQQPDLSQMEAATEIKEIGRKSTRKSTKHRTSQFTKGESGTRRSLEDDGVSKKHSSKQERKSMDLNNNISKTDASPQASPPEEPQPVSSETVPPAQPPPNAPKFSFIESLSDILLEEVELPLLGPSIQSPYNITTFSEKLEKHLITVDFLEKNTTGKPDSKASGNRQDFTGAEGKQKSKGPSTYNNVYIPKDEGVAPDDMIKEEYDKIINNGEGTESLKSNSVSQGTVNTMGKTSGKAVSNNSSSKSKKSSSHKRQSKEKHRRVSDVAAVSHPDTSHVSHGHVSHVSQDTKVIQSSDQVPKLTDRLGTELIWAANLLINLRLFDLADGVLAKHLYFYGKRTVQFIYLRAVSLYLRQREEEALPLIKEAIEYDNTNGMYYALEGHCYYVLGKTQEAIVSYEKALRLPHSNENRHLLYLRYGSLVLDQGKSKIAKRVFLHGVSKYPTPYMWLALGSACFQRQEFDQAEVAFSEANRLDSTNPIAWGHLTLSSLMQDKKALAEQSYKWALRYGLKKSVLLDEIQRLQKEKGFGDPSFPRVPNCVPHDYYLRRMGRVKPFNLYKEALNQDPPRMRRDRYDDTENEVMLKKKLEMMANEGRETDPEEWDGEEGYDMYYAASGGYANPSQSTGFNPETRSAPAEMMTIKPPSSRMPVVSGQTIA